MKDYLGINSIIFLLESVSTVIPLLIKFFKNVLIKSNEENVNEANDDGNIAAKQNYLLVTCSKLIGIFCYELKGNQCS